MTTTAAAWLVGAPAAAMVASQCRIPGIPALRCSGPRPRCPAVNTSGSWLQQLFESIPVCNLRPQLHALHGQGRKQLGIQLGADKNRTGSCLQLLWAEDLLAWAQPVLNRACTVPWGIRKVSCTAGQLRRMPSSAGRMQCSVQPPPDDWAGAAD